MKKLVAVEGMTLTYMATMEDPTTHEVIPMGVATVVATLGAASSNTSVDGKGVYVDGLQLTATTWQITTFTGEGSAVGNFESSAVKVAVDGSKVLLQGDKVSFDVTAQNTKPPYNSQTFTITATIQVAGQTSVTAE